MRKDSELAYMSTETSKKRKVKRLKKTEQTIQGLWDNHKTCNIYVMGIPEGDGREKGTEEILEKNSD